MSSAKQSVHPFLMFTGDAEKAMKLYVSLIPDSEILDIKYDDSEGAQNGKVKLASFRIGGQVVKCIDSPPVHAFNFTPSFSFFVDCESETDLKRISDGLLDGAGGTLMPPANYGFSTMFTWINDRYGVSWQLNVA